MKKTLLMISLLSGAVAFGAAGGVPPFNAAELNFRLQRFTSPTYRAAFSRDRNAMARLHASSESAVYKEIVQKYPDLGPRMMYNPKTDEMEVWFGAEKISSTPVKHAEDPTVALQRRNELRRKGTLTSAEQAEYDALLKDYPVRGI